MSCIRHTAVVIVLVALSNALTAAPGDEILAQRKQNKQWCSPGLLDSRTKFAPPRIAEGVSGLGAIRQLRSYLFHAELPHPHPNFVLALPDDTPREELEDYTPIARIGEFVIFAAKSADQEAGRQYAANVRLAYDRYEQHLRRYPPPPDQPYRRPEISELFSYQPKARDLAALITSGSDATLTDEQQEEITGYLHADHKLHPSEDSRMHFTSCYAIIADTGVIFSIFSARERNEAVLRSEFDAARQEMEAGSRDYIHNYSAAAEASRTLPLWQRGRLTIPLLYVDAGVPRAIIAGLKPVVRIGRYGLLAPADTPDHLVTEISYALLVMMNTDIFQQHLQRLGVRPSIGGPAEWQQLLASIPAREPQVAPGPIGTVATAEASASSSDVRRPVLKPIPPPPSGSGSMSSGRIGSLDNRSGLGLLCMIPKHNHQTIQQSEQARKTRLVHEAPAKPRKTKAEREEELRRAKEEQDRRFREATERSRQLREQEYKQATARHRQSEEAKNREASRSDAIMATIVSANGAPRVRLFNRTEVWLVVTYDLVGRVGNREYRSSGTQTVPAGTYQEASCPLYTDDEFRRLGYQIQVVNIRWKRFN